MLRKQWFTGQQKPPGREKMTAPVRKSMGEALAGPGAIHTYSYRPFLRMYALLTEEVLHSLSKTKGGGTRARPEVLSAFKNKKVMGIAIALFSEGIGRKSDSVRIILTGGAHQTMSLSRRGNAHIFCNFFPDYQSKRSSWKAKAKSNVNFELINALGTEKDVERGTGLCFYSYAGATALVGSGQNWVKSCLIQRGWKLAAESPYQRNLPVFTKMVTLTGKQPSYARGFLGRGGDRKTLRVVG